MKPHKNAELIKAWLAGAEIEALTREGWIHVLDPNWGDQTQFRIKKKPHKYAELIKAWADGAEIEVFNGETWRDSPNPPWFQCGQYRIKNLEFERLKKAYDRGETIQLFNGEEWRDCPNPGWIYPADQYRIKPLLDRHITISLSYSGNIIYKGYIKGKITIGIQDEISKIITEYDM